MISKMLVDDTEQFLAYATTILHDLTAIPPRRLPHDAVSFSEVVRHYSEVLHHTHASAQAYYPLLCRQWAAAWFALTGNFNGFLVDVERVWKQAREETLYGDMIEGMAQEIRCALYKSTIVAFAETSPFERQAIENSRKNNFAHSILYDMIPHLPIEQAWEIAQTIKVPFNRDSILGTLSLRLPSEEALKVAEGLQHDTIRASTLHNLIPYYEGDTRTTLIQKSLAAARTIAYPGSRFSALLAMLPYYEGDTQAALLQETLAVARLIQHALTRVWALRTVAEHYDEETRATLLEEALQVAYMTRPDASRAKALRQIALRLPLPKSFDLANAIQIPMYRTLALYEIVPRLPLTEALHIANTFEHPSERAVLLKNIACRYENPIRHTLLEKAIESARSIENLYWRVRLIGEYAQFYTEPQRSELIEETLQITRTSLEPTYQVYTLLAIAEYTDPVKQVLFIREAARAARSIELKREPSYAVQNAIKVLSEIEESEFSTTDKVIEWQKMLERFASFPPPIFLCHVSKLLSFAFLLTNTLDTTRHNPNARLAQKIVNAINEVCL